MSRAPRTNDFEDRDYYPNPRRSAPEMEGFEYRRPQVDLRVREREPDRTPAFLREDARRTEAGPMVLRQRDVETFDRRVRSPSPVRVREERIVRRPRSVSPPRFHDHHHDHDHDHEHEHERQRTRVIERERIREPSVVRRRSPSPQVVRYVERRERTPSPVEHEHIRTRIVQRERERERVPSPSPSPSPPPAPPQVIRGPTIEREVITHYRDIDHGMIRARPPSPPPAPAPRVRARERETDIDISLSNHRTEVDIRRSTTRARSRSRSRERRSHFHDDQLVVVRDSDRLRIDDRGSRRRAHSAAPLGSPVDEEAEYITSKIDSRGRMGEAWGGATKDWTIVDVPPGTERVRMDGVGGASTDTTWSKYSGVRRTQFIPERDGALVTRAPSPPPAPAPAHNHRDSLSVSVYDREKEIDIEKTIDRRITRTSPAAPPPKEMWTEITKDLVLREAIEELGYRYEETKWFYYIMDYLRYEEVLKLTELSDRIRRSRKDHVREIEWERDYREDWERRRHHHSHHRQPSLKWDDERVREREVIYDSRDPGGRVYYR
ncbi:hypothetical protein S7711_05563 [Stachybotrys chartarum IBT 7711]|uniref:DUF8035 domain-containing protein n=1 Tax=Stachybotrys chartarum (strain CBS 109288 / IBT 7711) TaxID=1280523 RepID=A0A084AKA4_STACB|nr:hypothetical protein S7711_05563 [Stachybotrys chartarum IBT 7711]KFA54014.1 hypothetical protein S40293_01829 [Stachybotrys chartarum IBT 40293]